MTNNTSKDIHKEKDKEKDNLGTYNKHSVQWPDPFSEIVPGAQWIHSVLLALEYIPSGQ